MSTPHNDDVRAKMVVILAGAILTLSNLTDELVKLAEGQ